MLDALYVQAACSPQASSQYEIANALLRHCLQPWLAMLRAWMLRGQLANTKWDLFVHDVGRDGVSNLWYDKFTIQKDHVPAFLNEDDTRKVCLPISIPSNNCGFHRIWIIQINKKVNNWKNRSSLILLCVPS